MYISIDVQRGSDLWYIRWPTGVGVILLCDLIWFMGIANYFGVYTAYLSTETNSKKWLLRGFVLYAVVAAGVATAFVGNSVYDAATAGALMGLWAGAAFNITTVVTTSRRYPMPTALADTAYVVVVAAVTLVSQHLATH